MKNNKSIHSTTLLCIAFIVLKLCKVINWSWWWIMSPIWITLFAAIILVITLVIIDPEALNDLFDD